MYWKDQNIGAMFQIKLEHLFADLSEGMHLSVKKKKVHQLRVEIRQIRTLLWMIRHDPEIDPKPYKQINRVLRKEFKANESLRAYQVYLIMINDDPIWKNVAEDLKKKISVEKEKKQKKQISNGNRLIKEIENTLLKKDLFKVTSSEKALDNLIETYRACLFDNSNKSIDTLHDLRIVGKKLKYIHEMGLVQLSRKMVTVLNVLHADIGKLHDYYEFKNYILKDESLKKKIEKKKRKKLACILEQEINKRMNLLQENVHEMKIEIYPSE